MDLNSEIKVWLKDFFKDNARFNEPLSKHTSFRVGGPAQALLLPETVDELKELLQFAGKKDIPVTYLGDGTNILAKDYGVKGFVIKLTGLKDEIICNSIDNDHFELEVSAGVRTRRVCKYCIENSLKGFNFATGIPGTIGGAIRMNAGTSSGSIQDVLSSVTILTMDGVINEITKDQLIFNYRNLDYKKKLKNPLIVKGRVKLSIGDKELLAKEAETYLEKRKKSQPLNLPNCGSFFKNPDHEKSAGWLIDKCGLKNFSVGGAKVSGKHANFIVNNDNATASDILTLMEKVKSKVYKQFSVNLEPEVKIIGY